VVTFTLWPLYPQAKSSQYPLDVRLGGPQNRSGHNEEKTSQLPPGSMEDMRNAYKMLVGKPEGKT